MLINQKFWFGVFIINAFLSLDLLRASSLDPRDSKRICISKDVFDSASVLCRFNQDLVLEVVEKSSKAPCVDVPVFGSSMLASNSSGDKPAFLSVQVSQVKNFSWRERIRNDNAKLRIFFGIILPRDMSLFSDQKRDFRCKLCGHIARSDLFILHIRNKHSKELEKFNRSENNLRF